MTQRQTIGPLEVESLVDLLRKRAAENADLVLYRFLESGEIQGELTAGQLWQRSQCLARLLRERHQAGDRVLLLFPAGLDFVVAFFACLNAGLIALPAAPPEPRRLNRSLPRLRSILADARPVLALTTPQLFRELEEAFAQEAALRSFPWQSLAELEDEVGADSAASSEPLHRPKAGDLAYLQYTSGSTAAPKGVMVSHGNVLHNSWLIREAWSYGPRSVAVMWVPNFHDDGLVHGLIQPLYSAFTTHLMAPMDFVARPSSWLEAISRFRATHSGGPNFAYVLARRKGLPAAGRQLDLSSWQVAYNAAEPVRRDTLEEFATAFEPHGFRREAFHPSFGLAETTLLVTTGRADLAPRYLAIDARALEKEHRVVVQEQEAEGGRVFVSCGEPVPETEVRIVDPESREALPPERVGEIWVANGSVAQGYWHNLEATEETFGGVLADQPGVRYLRTGDLGFLHDGELFITGRRKDLIILSGRNVYPQDVELVLERSHPQLRPGCGAAFAVEGDAASGVGSERLVVVQEVKGREPLPPEDVEAIAEAACGALLDELDVRLSALVLIPAGAISKTSSGKIQRQACRREYLEGSLEVLGSWQLGGSVSAEPKRSAKAEEILAWLRSYAPSRIHSRLWDERRSLPPHVVMELGERGLLGMQVSPEYGGLGLPTRPFLKILEQLGAIDLTLATFVTGANALGSRPVERFAPEPLRRQWLPALASGRRLAAFALTEPGAGSFPRALVSEARPRAGGGWSLHGEKLWSGSAAWASLIHVFVRQEGGDGLTAFAVPADSPGLVLGEESLTLGLRAMAQSALELDGVPVGEAQRLGRAGEGFAVAEDAMVFTRLCLAAVSLGGMRRCAQLMQRYASRRRVGTGRLLDNPVTRTRLSDLLSAITALESLVNFIAEALDEGRPVPQEAFTVCKIEGPELLWRAADDLVQLLGGRGYLENNLAPQILRDARVFRIFEGPTETLTMHLGSALAHGGEALDAFLRRQLGAPALADRLRQADSEARQRLASLPALGGVADALYWRHCLLGEAAAAAVLQAAVEHRKALGPTPALERAALWAADRANAALERARAGHRAEAHLLSVENLEREVAALAVHIGDLDPPPAAEDHRFDDLLKRATPPVRDAEPMPASFREAPVVVTPESTTRTTHTGNEIKAWVLDWLEEELGLDASRVEADRPLATLGLDSITAVRLATELGEWLRSDLERTLVFRYPTLETLARGLAGEEAPAAPAAPSATEPDEDLERLLAEIEGLSDEEVRGALEPDLEPASR